MIGRFRARAVCRCGRVGCRTHRRRDARSSSARGYGAPWRKLRATVLLEERVCPGYPAGIHGEECTCALSRRPHGRDHVRTNSVDHVVPKSRGGTDARANLRGFCGRCNSRKAVLEEGARPR